MDNNLSKETQLERILRLYQNRKLRFAGYEDDDYEGMELVCKTWLRLSKRKNKNEEMKKDIEYLEYVLENYSELNQDFEFTEDRYPETWGKFRDDDPRWVHNISFKREIEEAVWYCNNDELKKLYEDIMEKVETISKKSYDNKYYKEKKQLGYGTQFLNRYTPKNAPKKINKNNKAEDLLNIIDDIYEESFNHMYSCDPAYKPGYDDNENYVLDTIRIMKTIIDHIDKTLKSNNDETRLNNRLIDLRELLVYYNALADYRGRVNGCKDRYYPSYYYNQNNQDVFYKKNQNLFRLDTKQLAHELLGNDISEKKVTSQYTEKVEVFDKPEEEAYLPMHLQTSHYEDRVFTTDPCVVFCKSGINVDSIDKVRFLAENGKLVITELPEYFDKLYFLNAGLFNPNGDTEQDEDGYTYDGEVKMSGREKTKECIKTMSKLYPDFTKKTLKVIKDSAKQIMKERIDFYNNNFKNKKITDNETDDENVN